MSNILGALPLVVYAGWGSRAADGPPRGSWSIILVSGCLVLSTLSTSSSQDEGGNPGMNLDVNLAKSWQVTVKTNSQDEGDNLGGNLDMNLTRFRQCQDQEIECCIYSYEYTNEDWSDPPSQRGNLGRDFHLLVTGSAIGDRLYVLIILCHGQCM